MHNHNPDPNRLAKDTELARYDAVRWIEEAVKSGLTLERAIQNAAVRPWGGKTYAAPTLERWYYAYRLGGFDALRLRERADKGTAKALSPETCEALAKVRKEHPQLNITSLVRQLESTGVIPAGSVSISTIYRLLARLGLDPRTMKALAHTVTGGPTKAFEFAFANELWMTDAMTGPTLRPEQGPAQKTHLLAFLDDCSRVCPHGQYYPAERLEYYLDAFQHALRSRGIPAKLYTDNGGIFTSRHVQTVCAAVGITLLHHKPYHAWSKGKIERFFLTVQRDFEQRLVFQPVSSLAELNSRFWQWLNAEYHQRPHGALAGQSPGTRFAARAGQLRVVYDGLDLASLFLARTTRRVRLDATISLDGKVFEAPVALRGRNIEVRYDPFAFARVEIWLDDRFLANAKLCDKYLNSRTFDKENYEKPE
ncbi:MAG: DDE-type integrase/transposase/recombinase [Acidobacteriota bacterium]